MFLLTKKTIFLQQIQLFNRFAQDLLAIKTLSDQMIFCNLPKKQTLHTASQSLETYNLPNSLFSIQITYSLKGIETVWDEASGTDNVLMKSQFLSALENYPPQDMRFCYVIFYEKAQAIGAAYLQMFHVKVSEGIQKESAEEKQEQLCLWQSLMRGARNWILRRADFNLLICGNLLLTGEYGYRFKPQITEKQQVELVRQATDILPTILQTERNYKTSMLFYKDYEVGQHEEVEKEMKANNYHGFLMQPSMYMDIRPNWKTFDNYLDDMQSKYRVRARRAIKKGTELQKKELSETEIWENIADIHQLYCVIAKGAGFNAFLLHEHYFWALKKYLGENFKLVAYYLNGKMVAFYTVILNGREMEAHFLGVDAELNHEYQIYLNILYDLAKTGIYYQVERIDFARTAFEIKTSIGAVPRDMHCFMRHRNSFSSALLKFALNYFSVKEKWQQRHPFKDSPAAEAETE